MNERIKELILKAGFPKFDQMYVVSDGEELAKFAELIRADEREECAKVCEVLAEEVREWSDVSSYENAALFIRARGEVK